jgi:hypothetical protein
MTLQVLIVANCIKMRVTTPAAQHIIFSAPSEQRNSRFADHRLFGPRFTRRRLLRLRKGWAAASIWLPATHHRFAPSRLLKKSIHESAGV